MYLFSKPFPEYRWRWATLTPTESLNIPEINYGCLKVLASYEGEKVNLPAIFNSLLELDEDIKKYNLSEMVLARDPKRNIFRNSGQYWKNTGLLESTSHGIVLSDFGRAYSRGKITKDEFSAFIIKRMQLPNHFIEPENFISAWSENGLTIKPLELILSLLCGLYRNSIDNAYLTAGELVDIVIPMSGNKFDNEDIISVIEGCRAGKSLAQKSWTATESSNDIRMAREFLLFLHNYGYLMLRPSRDKSIINRNMEFYLESWQYELAGEILSSEQYFDTFKDAIKSLSEASNSISRRRVLTEVLIRPKQTVFRKELLKVYSKKCLLSNASVSEVLQACHIVPVKNNGKDSIDNGIILRSDLHLLYDSGHLKILEDGKIELSDFLKDDPFYSATIPDYVKIPSFINLENIRARNSYNM